jgi:hypothetical protein
MWFRVSKKPNPEINIALTRFFGCFNPNRITFAEKIILVVRNLSKVVLILLATVLLASNTGLIYSSHYCHGRLTDVTLYPGSGISDSKICECTPDANHSADIEQHPGKYQLKAQNCCSNISAYSKLDFDATQVIQQDNRIIKLPIIFRLPEVASITETVETISQILVFSKPVHPVSGRELVVFLLQLRIPFAKFFC